MSYINTTPPVFRCFVRKILLFQSVFSWNLVKNYKSPIKVFGDDERIYTKQRKTGGVA